MKVNFYLAEVIKSTEFDTYITPQNRYAITARTYATGKTEELYCIPANSNIKQIPLIGEHVLIFQGTNQFSSVNKYRNQWYYFPGFNIQSNINNNALPGIAKMSTSNVMESDAVSSLGNSFKDKSVSSLQQYEGDIILEGRFSNSIRLGGSVVSGKYQVPPSWEGPAGDPIIIISNNNMKVSEKNFTIEDPDQGSVIYLTSNQKLSTLRLRNQLSKSQSYTEFDGSQIVGVANRIIFSAKTDSIILDSPTRITCNTPEVRIGSENGNHPLVKGNLLIPVLMKIVGIIKKGVIVPAGAGCPTPEAFEEIIKVTEDIGKINSEAHRFDR